MTSSLPYETMQADLFETTTAAQRCRACGETKALDAFYSKDGRRSAVCRACARAGGETECARCRQSFRVTPQGANRYCSPSCCRLAVEEQKRMARLAAGPAKSKRCPRCGETKAVECFGSNRWSQSGLSNYCLPCMRKMDSERYYRNRERVLAEAQARYAEDPAYRAKKLHSNHRCRAANREKFSRDGAVVAVSKRCPACGETKDAEHFHRDCNAPDGLSGYCRPCALARQSRWRATNRQRIRARANKKYRESADYRRKLLREQRDRYATNPAMRIRGLTYNKQWYARNIERARAYSRNYAHIRRARKESAPGTFTQRDVVRIWHRQRGECAACGLRFGKRPAERGFHIDHIAPLSKPELEPSNWPRNLQLLCHRCNESKGAKSVAAWRLHLRRLGKYVPLAGPVGSLP